MAPLFINNITFTNLIINTVINSLSKKDLPKCIIGGKYSTWYCTRSVMNYNDTWQLKVQLLYLSQTYQEQLLYACDLYVQ